MHANDSLLELAGYDVGKDLELLVRMCTKAGLRVDSVLVDDSETAKLVVFSILVPLKDGEVSCGLR